MRYSVDIPDQVARQASSFRGRKDSACIFRDRLYICIISFNLIRIAFKFRRQLEYKTIRHGGVMGVVSPRHTSTTCPECRHVSPDSRPRRSRFRCVACGFEEHADGIGAINVRRAKQARIACEVSDAVMSPAAGTRRNDLRLRDAA